MSNLFLPSPAALTVLVLLAWNISVLLLFGIDKHAAVNGLRRVPERRLVTVIMLFGALGAFLGQRLFRHKTCKAPFTWLVPLMSAVQIAAAVGSALVWGGL